jgi:hypothetical protein
MFYAITRLRYLPGLERWLGTSSEFVNIKQWPGLKCTSTVVQVLFQIQRTSTDWHKRAKWGTAGVWVEHRHGAASTRGCTCDSASSNFGPDTDYINWDIIFRSFSQYIRKRRPGSILNVPHLMYLFWDTTLRHWASVPDLSGQSSGLVKGRQVLGETATRPRKVQN